MSNIWEKSLQEFGNRAEQKLDLASSLLPKQPEEIVKQNNDGFLKNYKNFGQNESFDNFPTKLYFALYPCLCKRKIFYKNLHSQNVSIIFLDKIDKTMLSYS